jgi:pimeloyl-ACP methyl ester carboxylesterase
LQQGIVIAMTTLAHPTIFVPGWLGTTLKDEYRLPHEAVWSTLTRDFERATLHPDNLQFESIEPARVVPDQVHELAYKELIEELRHGLSPSEDEPVPVYAFKYDWRQPLVAAEAQLARFVEEVIERTKLLRHYDAAGWGRTTEAKVNLVGHSLGGVLIAGYLEQSRGAHHVHKVATLAAPFQGAFEAVAQITTGTANLGSGTPSSREREAARVTPGLYHMLGSFDGGLLVDDGIGPRSLFDIGIWQGSVIDTLERFIRRHGLDRGDPAARARALFSHMLQTAGTHRARIDTLDLGAIGLAPAQWLCVVGVNAKTRIRLRVVRRGTGFDFDFRPEDRDNKWGDADPGIARLTGDGGVPLNGAVPKFLPLESLVCVTPDDFGYWEVQDRLFAAVAGFHSIMPNMDMLHRLIVAHLTDSGPRHDNIWGRPAPGVTAWTPPIPGLRRGETT